MTLQKYYGILKGSKKFPHRTKRGDSRASLEEIQDQYDSLVSRRKSLSRALVRRVESGDTLTDLDFQDRSQILFIQRQINWIIDNYPEVQR